MTDEVRHAILAVLRPVLCFLASLLLFEVAKRCQHASYREQIAYAGAWGACWLGVYLLDALRGIPK